MTAKKTDIWMPLYVAEYLADTLHLSTEQHGAYMLMLMACWKNEGRIPSDDESLASITKLPLATWKKYRTKLVAFFEVEGESLMHGRVIKERERAQAVSNERSIAGKKSAEAKAAKRRLDENNGSTIVAANAAANPQQNATQSQSQLPTPSVPDGTGIAAPNVRLADLIEEGCDPQAAKDWLAVRAKSRAPLTATAWAGVKREAAKAGMTVPDAVAMAAERSWRGFDAEWVKRGSGSRPGNDRSVAARTMFDVSEREVVDV